MRSPSLSFYVFSALVSFAASLLLVVVDAVPAAAYVHMVLALGVMPLIMAAMLYFVPVLTRTQGASGAVVWLPLLAMSGGVVQVLSMLFDYGWYPLAAVLGILACGGMLWWMWRAGRCGLNRPHAGYYWYLAALACLLLALMAMLLATVWPHYWRPLRLFHLHLNLLGFVGLTVVGTVRVLLPTVVQRGDPQASLFLRRNLHLVLGGVLLVAAGAATGWKILAWSGLLLWVIPLLLLLLFLWREYRSSFMARDSADCNLVYALLGWMLCLLAGLLHGEGIIVRELLLGLFLTTFLLPLVTGAASYLLPVWVWPGQQGARHERVRRALMRGSGWRVMAFYAVVPVSLLTETIYGALLALSVLLLFLWQVLRAFRAGFSAG